METVRIELDAFGVNTDALDRIKFVFDGTPSGEITIDGVTFSN